MTDVAINVVPDSEAVETERASDEKVLGFWVFLLSDAILFLLLFAIFVVRSHHAGDTIFFPLPHGFAETALLLASSATLGFARNTIATARRRRTLLWLCVTFGLGLGFVAMEVLRLHGMALADAGPSRGGLVSALFVLVGANAAHVGAGLAWIFISGCELALRGSNPFLMSRFHRLGLFWHFITVVWIGILFVVDLPGSI